MEVLKCGCQNMNTSSKKLFFCLRIFFLGICLGFSSKSIYEALAQLISSDTTVNSGVLEHPNGIEIPNLIVCNESGFKNLELNTNMKDYLANTIQQNETILKIGKDFMNDLSWTGDYKVRPIYTAYRGTCYILETHGKVG